MTSLLSLLFLGFFLGMRHATDSDHVMAVTTIVSKQRSIRGAALTGIFWGIGHSLTVLIVGGAIVLLGIVVPERLGLSLELCVAMMLVGLGALNLREMRHWLRNRSQGAEGESHDSPASLRMEERWGKSAFYQMMRPVIIGIIHGLAGSAAVALLVLPAIQTPLRAMAYLSLFGAGTIAGMMFVTAAIAVPVTYAADRFGVVQRYVGATAGLLSVGFGIFLFWDIGFAQGLFTR
jgi:high-affinity nickel-transport protein